MDEKYFEYASKRKSQKRRKGVTPESLRCQSKRFKPKTMFLVAVGKPNLEHKFDGRIACHRVCAWKTALRKSVKHAKGDMYLVDTTLDAELMEEILITKILPAAREKMHWVETIQVQSDNASPHGKSAALDKAFKKFGCERFPQPAQSPDLNVLDLTVNSSLQAAVDKLTPGQRLTLGRGGGRRQLNRLGRRFCPAPSPWASRPRA